jgi:hypothetical protein
MPKINSLKPDDCLEVPGRLMYPPRPGTFLISVKWVDCINGLNRIIFYGDSHTVWLEPDTEFKSAQTTLDYSGETLGSSEI